MHVLLQDQRGRFVAAAARVRDSVRVLGRSGPRQPICPTRAEDPWHQRASAPKKCTLRTHFMHACMPNDRLAIAIARASCEPTDAMRVMHASP